MRRQPPQAADAHRQRAHALLDALPLLPDDEAEARSVHAHVLADLSLNPFDRPSWLSAFHLLRFGLPGPLSLL
jgi:hypothetical protein